jgi:septum formation topological specificity factor MinE
MWDPWHEKSLKSFTTNETLYWSKTVKDESKKKHLFFIKKYKNFLNKIIWELTFNSKSKLLNKQDILNIIMKYFHNDKNINNLKNSIKQIWNEHNLKENNENKELILSIFKNLIMGFEYLSENRRKQFEKLVILKNRDKNYPEVLNNLKNNAKKYKLKCHYPDDEIILDAHHISLLIKDYLNFLTSDKSITIYGKNMTNINSFIYLKDL